MFAYSPNRYSLFDKIFFLNSNKKLNVGDLISVGESIFLVLGDEIAFASKYKNIVNIVEYEVLQRGLFSKKALELINWMVYTYYTTYKNVFNLFVSDDDFLNLLRYDFKSAKKIVGKDIIFDFETYKLDILSQPFYGQQLVVFPDLWTLNSLVGDSSVGYVLHGHSSPKQKLDAFYGIKTGKISTLFCTYSGIFQDFKDLKKIIVIDSHKWYYKNQQDPRYNTVYVLEKMAQIYGINIQKYGFELE